MINEKILGRWHKSYKIEGEHHIWTGPLVKESPYFNLKGKKVRANRMSVEIASNTKLPKGVIIRRICDERLCVAPSHLTRIGPPTNTAQSKGDIPGGLVEARSAQPLRSVIVMDQTDLTNYEFVERLEIPLPDPITWIKVYNTPVEKNAHFVSVGGPETAYVKDISPKILEQAIKELI